VTLHQDALRALDQGPPPECALKILVLGEPPKHDFDRALPVLDVVVVDLSEDAALRRLADEVRVSGVQQNDHGARSFANDLVDQGEGVLRALSETDERDVRPLSRGSRTHFGDVDLVCDYLVPQPHDDGRNEGQAILTLVRDQDAQVLCLAGAHRGRSTIPGLTVLVS